MTGVEAVEGDGRLSIRCLIQLAKKATREEWSPCLRKMNDDDGQLMNSEGSNFLTRGMKNKDQLSTRRLPAVHCSPVHQLAHHGNFPDR
jgi:hypothetical protein